MPRASKRERTNQVAPDQLIKIRTDGRWQKGALPAEGSGLPFYATSLEPSVFDTVDINLVTDSFNNGMPYLMLSTPLHGYDYLGRETIIRKASLLTITTKMHCASFSLPAGPTPEHGTCAAANIAKRGRGLRDPSLAGRFICDVCYSLGGNYATPVVGTSQVIRHQWVMRQLEEDPTGDLLAMHFINAIRDYAL